LHSEPVAASLPARIAARLIDVALSALLAAPLAYWAAWPLPRVLLLWAAILLAGDMLGAGISWGKQCCGIAVIHRQTQSICGPWRAGIRVLTMLLFPVLDWLPVRGLRRQRLGDYLCDTRVVNAASLPSASNEEVPELCLQTVAVFGSMLEAEILRARLDAAGIPAIVVDGNLVQAYALIAIAVGGVRVQVMSDYAARANELVQLWEQGALAIEPSEADD
jgi:uncharacterized RDD family membrane protein YckC